MSASPAAHFSQEPQRGMPAVLTLLFPGYNRLLASSFYEFAITFNRPVAATGSGQNFQAEMV